MGNACRICHTPKKKMISLSKNTPNAVTLKVEGEEFEYCFGLKVLEVPKHTKICMQCRQQLHSFYLFKQKAIKSHHKFSHKVKKVKKKAKIKLLNQSENIKNVETKRLENDSESDCTVNEPKKIKFDGTEDDQLQEIGKMSVKILADTLKRNIERISDNKETNDINKEVSESNDDSNLKLPEPKQKIIKYENSSDDSADDIFEQIMAEKDRKRKFKYKKKKKSRDKAKNSSFIKLNCELCCKHFKIKETYDAHMNIHKGLPAYSCEICGKGFKSKHKMHTHIKSHNNQRDFICALCSKAFLTKFNLRAHMKYHSDEKDYICDECGKLFKTKAGLNEHKETHSKEKHECSICHSKLNTKGTLKCHMRGVHGLYNNPNIFCTICQKQFIKKNYFTTHMAKKHPEKRIN